MLNEPHPEQDPVPIPKLKRKKKQKAYVDLLIEARTQNGSDVTNSESLIIVKDVEKVVTEQIPEGNQDVELDVEITLVATSPLTRRRTRVFVDKEIEFTYASKRVQIKGKEPSFPEASKREKKDSIEEKVV